MNEGLGGLCVLVALIIIVITLHDKYMKKDGMVSEWPDAGIYGTGNGAYPYDNYSGYSGPNRYRPGGWGLGPNPYTLA